MADDDLGALVVRAPDNVLYLSNFLPMKACGVRKVGQAASLYSWMSPAEAVASSLVVRRRHPAFASLPDRRALPARSAAQRRVTASSRTLGLKLARL
jgi:hypothetical protein